MNQPLRTLTIVGTRPEAIKLAPVVRRLAADDNIENKVVLSGQHREMVHSALAIFGIAADVDLALMTENQTLSQLTSALISTLDPLFWSERPDWVIVQGDTTTAFAAALVAFYRQVPVAHVEAGLRTHDSRDPFPEEINRRFIDQLATLHFAPTERARRELLCEGIDDARIFVTGNTGIDALLEVAARGGRGPDELMPALSQGLRLLLVTAHRRENFGAPLRRICRALRTLVERHPDILIVYAVHSNPNVRRCVRGALSGVDRIWLIDAPDYESFVALMRACHFILTDSGGIQEEAPSLGKPVLVLRRTTERLESIAAGVARLVGTGEKSITEAAEQLLRDRAVYASMSRGHSPYGDGFASERIVRVFAEQAKRGSRTPPSPPDVVAQRARAEG